MAASLISAHGLERSVGERPVLDGVSLTIEVGDRVGLIGRNGAGKSTLIRCLLDLEPVDAGEIIRKRDLRARVVEQVPRLDPDATVGEAVLSGLEAARALEAELEAVEAAMPTADPTALEALVHRQAELGERLQQQGGRNFRHRAEAMLHALSAPSTDRRMGELSLGERRRVALAAGLLEAPELLILDEPTNHLDVETIEWLEEHLRSYSGGILVVTHDRHFLDRVVTRIAEIDRGELATYPGNYRRYLEQKAERDAAEARAEANRRRAIRSELDWVRRGPPARTTKSKARLQRFDAMVDDAPKARLGEASFRLPHPPRIGKTILELKKVTKRFGARTLIRDLDLVLTRGARVGIVGPNGAGKTTLLRMILGELDPDGGEIVRGHNTVMVYADQGRTDLDDDNTVIEEVAGDGDKVFVGDHPVQVHTFLEGLLFDGAQQRAKVGTLSGGERTRVALAKRLREAGNLLVLDEPTNDLDLATLRVLEDALVDYPGCVLVVSHDRWFLDRVTTAVLAFEGDGRVVLHEGGHADWRAHRDRAARPPPDDRGSASPTPKPARPGASLARPGGGERPRKKRRGFAEQREFEGMEAAILAAEADVETREARLADPAVVRELGAKVADELRALDAARARVEALYTRWEALSELDPYG